MTRFRIRHFLVAGGLAPGSITSDEALARDEEVLRREKLEEKNEKDRIFLEAMIKKPDMAGRLAVVLHWLGCALAILSVPVAVWAFITMTIKYDLASGAVEAAIFLGAGFCAWLVGHLAIYLLIEDSPLFWPLIALRVRTRKGRPPKS